MQRLRQPAIGRLEWAIWPIYVSKQAEKFLHPLVSAMGHEILQDSFDQVRMRFEIVILATTIIAYPGVWMRSWRELQKVVRSILNGNGHRFDLLGRWGCSNVRRDWLFHTRHQIYTFAGSWPLCFGLAYIGFLLGVRWNSDPIFRRLFHEFDAVIVTIAIAGLAWSIWARWRERHRSEK
jgi:hypothetical protein